MDDCVVADATVVNPNASKTLLANGFSTFPIKGNPAFSNGPKYLLKNRNDCSVFCNWVFYKFILTAELFANALHSLETCVLVNNILFSSWESPIIFDKNKRNI